MKFKLTTTKSFYPLKHERESLEKLGFTFEVYYGQENHITGNPEITFNNLKGLMDFVKTYGDIVLGELGDIEIYNDHRE